MEDWTAAGDEPKALSTDRIDGCDLFVLLVARTRGFVPEGDTRSITQQEYDYAIRNKIEILAFLLDDSSMWYSEFDHRDSDTSVVDWRNDLLKSHVVDPFNHEPDSIRVLEALSRWQQDRVLHATQAKLTKYDWARLVAPRLGIRENDPELESIAGDLLPIALAASEEAYLYKYPYRRSAQIEQANEQTLSSTSQIHEATSN